MLHDSDEQWLLFFYSIAAKPANGRIKIWRRLVKAGAALLKGAVYILPFSDEHYEFFQWLTTEVVAMRGEASFSRVSKIETLPDGEIIRLFNRLRKKDYDAIGKTLEEILVNINSLKAGSKTTGKRLTDRFHKCLKEYEGIKKIDFFNQDDGELVDKIEYVRNELSYKAGIVGETVMIRPCSLEDYKGKIWVTRELPFVDRMSSVWLIKKFIDGSAIIELWKEKDITGSDSNVIAFDVPGGEFSHRGNLCTFEVLVKSFGFKDKALKTIAEIVHDIDIRDDEYGRPESTGIEEILKGIKKTSKNDLEALEKGYVIFEMLYASKAT